MEINMINRSSSSTRTSDFGASISRPADSAMLGITIQKHIAFDPHAFRRPSS